MRRVLHCVLLPVGVLALAGCSDSVDANDVATPAYWDSCPDFPVWDRNVDNFENLYPGEAAYESPGVAVRHAVASSVEVQAERTTGRTATVHVRMKDQVGVFIVQRVRPGWVVKRGEGCAAWPAGEQFLGPIDESDCDRPEVSCLYSETGE